MSVPDPTQRFFGSLLMGVGVVMMGLCGACSAASLIFVVPAALSWFGRLISGQSPASDDYGPAIVQAFGLFGIIPILVGWGVYAFGRRLRGGRPEPKPVWPPRDAP